MIEATSELRALRRLISTSPPTFNARINALVDVLGGPDGYGRKQWLAEAGGIGRHTAARWLDGEDWDPKSNVLEDFAARVTHRWSSVSKAELAHWLKTGTLPDPSQHIRDDSKQQTHIGNPMLLFRICCAIDAMAKANGLVPGTPGFEDIVTTAMEHLISFCRESRSELTDELLYSIANSVRILIQNKVL